MYDPQDEIIIQQYNSCCGCFIISTISYEKYCSTKILVIGVKIVYKYLIN